MEFETLILMAFHLIGLVSSFDVILKSRTPQGAIAWVISLNTIPIVTVPIYWMIGQNKFDGYRRTWKRSFKTVREKIEGLEDGLEPYLSNLPEGFPEYMGIKALAEFPFMHGNHISLLKDGQETYQSIANGIEGASSYVLFQFYILRDDEIGNVFQKQLIRKAREGVSVYILFDKLGSRGLSSKWIQELRCANIRIVPFSPVSRRPRRFHLNFRNHRKIVVVDGLYIWLGGLNIGNEYLGRNPVLTPWRDTHLEIKGPAALAAQAVFFTDWRWAIGESLHALNWSAQAAQDANSDVLVLASGPADRHQTASFFFTHLINIARRRIWISTPYFIPDEATMTALCLAALKGIEICILTPRLNDIWFAHQAAQVYLGKLIRHGAKVYYFENGFLHQKVVLVDDRIAVVGTVNFDNRSFHLNFEVSAVVADRAFAANLEKMLLDDLAHSTELTVNYFQIRTRWHRIKTRGCALLAPML